jgi:predicted phosphodiesterase
MLYGVFSDVHANLEALTAVLDFFRSHEIDRYLCAGDFVGYGPNPNECVSIVRKLPMLRASVGNHDRAVCGLKDITWFNEYAQKAIIWTRQVLTQENQIYLSELPKMVNHSEYTLVHGSPRDPIDEYLLTWQQYQENLPYIKGPVAFVGHSHIPFVFGQNATHLLKESDSIILSPEEKYVINVGAVGQPRDGNNRASCGIYDSNIGKFDLYRINYDIRTTQDKMRQARMPGFLIERLNWGK